MSPLPRAALGALLACSALFLSPASATDIKVMASVAPQHAYEELQPLFEKKTGHKVTTAWLPTVEMMQRLKAGEVSDVVLISAANMDELAKLGVVVPGSRVEVVKSGIGVAIRKGAPRPDISSAAKLKETLLAAKSVSYSTGPSGVYLVSLFEKLGLTEALKPKLKVIQGTPVGVLVARGEAEIGFQQVPEIIPVQGIEYLGPLPAEVQFTTVFPMAVHVKADAAHAAAGKQWIEFLHAPEAAAVMKKFGLEPGP